MNWEPGGAASGLLKTCDRVLDPTERRFAVSGPLQKYPDPFLSLHLQVRLKNGPPLPLVSESLSNESVFFKGGGTAPTPTNTLF